MHSTLIHFLISEIIQDQIKNKQDVEKKLHEMGEIIGMKLLEYYNFNKETDISSLLYKITYDFLPLIFETNRKVEHFEGCGTYVITEMVPLLGAFIDPPAEYEGFAADSIIAGIIEVAVRASGFRCSVTAYVKKTEGYPTRTMYYIETAK